MIFINNLNLQTAWELEFTIKKRTLLDMIIMAVNIYALSYQRKMLTDNTKMLKELLDQYTEVNVKHLLNPQNIPHKNENDERLKKSR